MQVSIVGLVHAGSRLCVCCRLGHDHIREELTGRYFPALMKSGGDVAVIPEKLVAIAVVLDDDEGLKVILKSRRVGVGCLVEKNHAVEDCKNIRIHR